MTDILERKMTWDEFVSEFKPVKNTQGDDAWGGCMFETFGQDINIVLAAGREKVWTLFSEGNSIWIGEGFHIVNRLGYFITEVPRATDDCLQYIIDEDTWEDEDNDWANTFVHDCVDEVNG